MLLQEIIRWVRSVRSDHTLANLLFSAVRGQLASWQEVDKNLKLILADAASQANTSQILEPSKFQWMWMDWRAKGRDGVYGVWCTLPLVSDCICPPPRRGSYRAFYLQHPRDFLRQWVLHLDTCGKSWESSPVFGLVLSMWAWPSNLLPREGISHSCGWCFVKGSKQSKLDQFLFLEFPLS